LCPYIPHAFIAGPHAFNGDAGFAGLAGDKIFEGDVIGSSSSSIIIGTRCRNNMIGIMTL
jgi:hypothetical protein